MAPTLTTIEHPAIQPDMEHAIDAAPKLEHRIPASDGFKLIRSAALRLSRFGVLPHADAEDLAAELVMRELAQALAAKMPNTIRLRHTTGAYVRLEALNYRKTVLARRLAEATEDGSIPDLEAEDITEREASRPAPVSPLGTLADARQLARRLELPEVCAHALAQGLWQGDGAELAEALGIAPGTWRNRVSTGAKLIRATYPDPTALADLIDRGVVVRSRALAARRIGAPLPASGDRHRTAPQMAREANVLIARPQRPGRMATVTKQDHWRTEPAPDHWHGITRRTDVLIPSDLLRDIARRLELATTEALVSGPRPHRAAHDIPEDLSGITFHPEPDMSRDGRGFLNRPARAWKLREPRAGAEHRSVRAWRELARTYRRRTTRSKHLARMLWGADTLNRKENR